MCVVHLNPGSVQGLTLWIVTVHHRMCQSECLARTPVELSELVVRRYFLHIINPHEAPGSDGIGDRLLKLCGRKLALYTWHALCLMRGLILELYLPCCFCLPDQFRFNLSFSQNCSYLQQWTV